MIHLNLLILSFIYDASCACFGQSQRSVKYFENLTYIAKKSYHASSIKMEKFFDLA